MVHRWNCEQGCELVARETLANRLELDWPVPWPVDSLVKSDKVSPTVLHRSEEVGHVPVQKADEIRLARVVATQHDSDVVTEGNPLKGTMKASVA